MGVDALLSSCLGCPACIVLLGILLNFTNSHTNAFFLLFSSLALIIFALKSHIIAHIDTPPQHITCYAIFAVSSLFFQTEFVYAPILLRDSLPWCTQSTRYLLAQAFHPASALSMFLQNSCCNYEVVTVWSCFYRWSNHKFLCTIFTTPFLYSSIVEFLFK